MFEQIVKDKANVYFLIGIVAIATVLQVTDLVLGFFQIFSSILSMFTLIASFLIAIILYLMTAKEKAMAGIAFVLACIGFVAHISNSGSTESFNLFSQAFNIFIDVAYILFGFILLRINTIPGKMLSWGLIAYSCFRLCMGAIVNSSFIGRDVTPLISIMMYVWNLILLPVPFIIINLGLILHLLSFTKNNEVAVQE